MKVRNYDQYDEDDFSNECAELQEQHRMRSKLSTRTQMRKPTHQWSLIKADDPRRFPNQLDD